MVKPVRIEQVEEVQLGDIIRRSRDLPIRVSDFFIAITQGNRQGIITAKLFSPGTPDSNLDEQNEDVHHRLTNGDFYCNGTQIRNYDFERVEKDDVIGYRYRNERREIATIK